MQRSLVLAAVLAAIANLFWAMNAIVGKMIVGAIPAFTLSQYRWLGACLILAPFGWPLIIRQWAWYRERLPQLLVLSLFSVTLYNTLQYWSLEYTGPVTVGAMLALMPLAIAALATLLGQQKQPGSVWAMSGLAVLGALVVVTEGNWQSLWQGQATAIGALLMVLAIASWAVYSVRLNALPTAQVSVLGLLTFFVTIGTLGIVPFWLSEVSQQGIIVPTGSQWYAIAFVAFFPSIVSFFCWNSAVRLGDANLAGLMVTLAPLFNALLSIVWLKQPVSAMQWAGITLVMTGVSAALLMTRRHQQRLRSANG